MMCPVPAAAHNEFGTSITKIDKAHCPLNSKDVTRNVRDAALNVKQIARPHKVGKSGVFKKGGLLSAKFDFIVSLKCKVEILSF